jgi:two-component system response regulator DesR
MSLSLIKVLCVDDNELVGSAIRAKLEWAGGYEWVGQLPTADDLIEVAERVRPDVVLLDIDMPGRDPFSALEELTIRHPEVRALMLSGHISRALVDRAIEAGACGYFSKDDDITSMLNTIQDVARGNFALGPDVRAELLR